MNPFEHLVNRLHEREADAIAIRANIAQQRFSPTVNYELYERTERTTTITRVPIYNADDELVRIAELRALLEHYREAPDPVAIELLARSEGWTP